MRLHLLAAASVLAGSLFAADPGLLSLAVPDSQVMAGVNFEQVRLSPLGQYSLAQTGQLPDASMEKLLEAAGFDPRRDLRELLVSGSGQPNGGSAIFLVRGAFDVPKIVEAAGAGGSTIETYKGVSIISIKGNKQGAMAFPDATLAIVGEVAGVRAAIDRQSAPTVISSALAVRVSELSATEDAWFISMVPPAQLQPGLSAMGGNIQQASGGVKLGANLVVSLQAVSETDKDAAALAAALKGLGIGVTQMGGTKSDLASVAALLQNLNVTVEGLVTKVSLSVPETQIEQMMQASHASKPHGESAPQRGLETRSGVLSGSLPPPGAVPQRVRVAREVQKAKLIQHPEPAYPPLALQARISGVVRLNAIIGKDGTVENLTLVSGHPLLVQPALDTVKQWVYAPTLLNGQAVEVATQVEVNFTLEQ
jgi:TonB family protein